MSRNSSGTYTLPVGNPVVSGTVIEANWANSTLDDISAALTDSLSRSGKGGMSASLRIIDGTVSVPGWAFGNETGSGAYRSAAGDWYLTVLGADILRMRASGVNVTGALGVSGAATFSGGISGNPVINDGTANGVAYLNGSKVLTTGSALTYNGSALTLASSGVIYGDSTIITLGANTYFKAGSTTGFTVNDSTDAYNYFRILNNGNAVFYPSGTEGMRLTSTGLGIGTSSPSYKLQVTQNGNSNATSAVTNSTAGTSSLARFLAISDAGNAAFGMTSSSYTDITGAADSLLISAGSASGGMAFALDGVVNMRLDSSGNLGLGVTPSAWGGGYKAFDFYGKGAIAGDSINVWVMNNSYYNGTNYVYKSSTNASGYLQSGGVHSWYTAPSGTAGNAISFTTAMTLDASGNLGVGTTSPYSKLHAQFASTGEVARFSSTASSGEIYATVGYSTSTNAFNVGYNLSDGSGFLSAPYGSGYIGFRVAGSERMRIDSSGKVGIGTSSPYSPLDIYKTGADVLTSLFTVGVDDLNFRAGFMNGVAGSTGSLQARCGLFYLGSGEAATIGFVRGASATDGSVTIRTTGTERMRIDSSGNVGIGTSSPTNGKLVVSGSSVTTAQGISLYGDTLNVRLVAESATAGIGILGTFSNHSQTFYTDSTERMRIDSSGNLLVNRTTQLNASKVSLAYNGSAEQGLSINDTANANTSQFLAFYYGSNTFLGSITNNGGAAVSYNTTSDYRLKENVKPMDGALATVAKLNPVTYTWTRNGKEGQGFIAHELQAVVPDCVTGEKDAVDEDGNPIYQGIDTSFLVATLTKAIQELTARVAQLEGAK